jgi:hypothetical protein
MYYLIRYLPPKTIGTGEIVFGFSHGEYLRGEKRDTNLTLEDVKEMYPDKFETKGFYTLMKGTGETLTI